MTERFLKNVSANGVKRLRIFKKRLCVSFGLLRLNIPKVRICSE